MKSKPDLALDLGSSYRYENRKGANVYGCFGFAMPKKKRYYISRFKHPCSGFGILHEKLVNTSISYIHFNQGPGKDSSGRYRSQR